MNLISKIKKSLLENKEVSIAALAAVSTCVGNMVLGGECKLFAASVIFALIVNLFLFIKWTKQEEYTDNGRKVAKFAKFVLVAIAVLFVAFGFYCKATNHKHFQPEEAQTITTDGNDIPEGNDQEDQNNDENNNEGNTNQGSKPYTPAECPEDEKISTTKTITEESKTETKVTVENEEPVKVEVEDNSKEEEITQEAIKKAEENNIPVVEGDVKDENGNATGDKIVATEGHTSGTDLDLNTKKDEEPKKVTNNGDNKVDVSQAKPSQTVNKNENVESNETASSDDRLNEIFGVEEDIVTEEKVEIETTPNDVTVVEPETKEEPVIDNAATQDEVKEEVETKVEETKKAVEVKAIDGYETYVNSSVQFKISGDVDSIDGLDGIDYSFSNGVLTINTGSEATTLSVDVNGVNTVSFDVTINGIVK